MSFNSQSLKWVVLIVMILFTLPYLTVQSIGAGYLLENLTNGQIPYFTGATFLTLTVVLYVFLGGMRSVAHTDVFQGILVFTFMFAAMITIANNLGGFTEANYATYQLKSELFSRQGINIFFTPKRWFSYMLLWMLSVPMFPHIFMRFYISKTAISLKISTILYPIVTVFLFICPVMIGVWGHISFPELSDKASDQILPMMLTKYTSIWLTSGVTVAALAAFMSTLDSQLLALSSLLTRDVYTAYFRPHASFREQTAVGRVMTAILAIIGLIIAYRPPDTIFSIATEAFTGIAVLFPTMITALYSRNVPPQSCIVSIIVGEAALIGFQQGIIPQDFTFGFLPVVPIVLLSTLIILGGSLINPKNNIFNE